MGTRASFFIGNPCDLENRKWLGCIGWDGYPDGLPQLADVKDQEDFEKFVKCCKDERDDFADPEKGGFPFPWQDDLFLTDFTYAFFDGKLQLACFHHGFYTWEEYQADKETDDEDEENPELKNVAAPGEYDRSQPDSIMIIQGK